MNKLSITILSLAACALVSSCVSDNQKLDSASSYQNTRIVNYSQNSFQYLLDDYEDVIFKLRDKNTYKYQNGRPVFFHTDSDFAKRWVHRIIQKIDPNHDLFLKHEIDKIEAEFNDLFEHKYIDQLIQLDRIFDLAYQNMTKVYPHIVSHLSKKPTLNNTDDFINTEDWPATAAQRLERWNRKVDYDVMLQLLNNLTWQEARAGSLTRWERLSESYVPASPKDRFQIMVNTMLMEADENSVYYLPVDRTRLRMKLSLVGIGMSVQSQAGLTRVVQCVNGGPCESTQEILPGDIILSVAQGKSPFQSIIGMPLDEVVELIRGPRKSIVRLKLQRDLEIFEVSVVRDEIKLKDQKVNYEVARINQNGKTSQIAIIRIPKFYLDFDAAKRGDPNAISSTGDVRDILDSIKSKHIDGIIIDLRQNTGGALREAISISDLFVGKLPICQIKDKNRISVHHAYNEPARYTGPLMVLVDQNSAGGSEILAAAIQDHSRGIIVGYPTFGYGILRTLEPLRRGQGVFLAGEFFRVTGFPINNYGITPDVNYRFPYVANNENLKDKPLNTPPLRPEKTAVINKDLNKVIKHLVQSHRNHVENTSSARRYFQFKQTQKAWKSSARLNMDYTKKNYENYKSKKSAFERYGKNIDQELDEAKALFGEWLRIL